MKKGFLCVSGMVMMLSVTTANLMKRDDYPTTINNLVINASPTIKLYSAFINTVYRQAGLQTAGLDSAVFEKAVTGYYNLKMANKLSDNNNVITVIDFTKPSTTKRMWIVDLQKKCLLLKTWVAHGSQSGDDVPSQFSNEVDSFKSSVGFYVTDKVYMGKHGRSLRLDGMDEGYNDKAHERDIVVHAAPYVSQNSISKLGRLGRSQGCPAVSPTVVNRVIDTIKGKTVLFVNGNADGYTSKYLDEQGAAGYAFNMDSTAQGGENAAL